MVKGTTRKRAAGKGAAGKELAEKYTHLGTRECKSFQDAPMGIFLLIGLFKKSI